MRPEERDYAWLEDLLRLARETVQRTGQRPATMGFDDPFFLGWLESRFIKMGEAVRRLSSATRERHPHVPWQDVIDLRNILAHRYDDIHHDTLIVVLDRDVPRLIAQLEPIVAALPPPD